MQKTKQNKTKQSEANLPFDLSNFFCSFRVSDQTTEERSRQIQDTEGNIKKTGHLGQDIIRKEQK